MKNRVYLVLVVVFILFLDNCKSSNYCEVFVKDHSTSAMFLEQFGESFRFMQIKNESVSIRPGKSIIATCQNQNLNLRKRQINNKKLNKVKIICPYSYDSNENKNIFLEVNGKRMLYNQKQHQFICNENIIQFFYYNVSGCDHHTGIVAGYINKIGSSSNMIRLVEYCYDQRNMRTIFAHYVVTPRSSFIEEQSFYNIGEWLDSDINFQFQEIKIFSSNLHHIFNSTKIEKNWENSIGDTFENIDFTKTEIVPSKLIPFQYRLACDEYFNFALQWTGLKFGNWKILQDDLKNLANLEDALIYSGTSGQLKLKNSYGVDQKLFGNNHDMLESTIPIPAYFWTYVRTELVSFNDNSDIQNSHCSVVIVSINNPYLKLSELDENILCTDISEDIHWIYKLRKTKDIITLGYTYCCAVNQAMDFIPEIPKYFAEKSYKNIHDEIYEEDEIIHFEEIEEGDGESRGFLELSKEEDVTTDSTINEIDQNVNENV